MCEVPAGWYVNSALAAVDASTKLRATVKPPKVLFRNIFSILEHNTTPSVLGLKLPFAFIADEK